MATKTPTLVPTTSPHNLAVEWAGFAASGDVGTAVQYENLTDRTVQITGTFTGSPTIVIEGSNDGTNYETLTDPQGNALSFTAAGLEAISENPKYIRPRATAGTGGADVDVRLNMKGRR